MEKSASVVLILEDTSTNSSIGEIKSKNITLKLLTEAAAFLPIRSLPSARLKYQFLLLFIVSSSYSSFISSLLFKSVWLEWYPYSLDICVVSIEGISAKFFITAWVCCCKLN